MYLRDQINHQLKHKGRMKVVLRATILTASALVVGTCMTLIPRVHAVSPITFVKQVGSAQYVNATAVSAVSITIPAGGVAAGHTIILTVGNSGNDGVTVSSVTDSVGNTYTVDANKSQISYFENTAIVSGYAQTALPAGSSLTVHLSGTATIIEALASDWAGIAQNRVDRTATNIATSKTLQAGTVTTTQADELLVGSFVTNGNVTLSAPGTGFTAFATQFSGHLGSTYRNQWQEYRVVSQTGSYAAGATASASTGYAGAVVAYKAATTPPDTTPPSTPTNLAATGATMTSIDTTWTAATDDVGVTGYALYVNGVSVGSTSLTNKTFTALACGTNYTLGVAAFDAAGNASSAATLVAATAACDTTAPTVSLTAPADGSSVSGTIPVTATASDDHTVTSVQFQLDGIALGSTFTTAPYTLNWDTTQVTNGQHTLTAIARDAAGNAASSSVTVTVSNVDTTPPSVSITTPTNGASVRGQTAVSATATDRSGIAQVQFQVDGANVGSPLATAPFTATLDTTTMADGSHALTAVATDAASNSATSAAVTINVDNSAPLVNLSAPVDGATLNGTVAVTASASDGAGVAGVQFRLDGANLGAELTAAPYAYSWSTTTAANGQHTLTAIARDAAGNMTTATAVTVTVANTNTLSTMHIISQGKPAYGDGNVIYSPSFGNDNNYGSGSGAYLCGPPCSLMIDLSSIPAAQRQQAVVDWHVESDLYYAAAINATYYNEPKDYTIDVSYAPGGTPPTSWTTLVTVNGNFYNGRMHAVNLNGANWVRMRVTGVNGSSGNMDASFNLDVLDASAGYDDSWLLLGDSITEDDQGLYEPSNFMQQVTAAHPGRWPVVINGGIGGWTAGSALETDPRTGQVYIDEFLASFPGHFVSLDYGTNEAIQGGQQLAGYTANMTTLINKVIAAGKVPVLRQTIPWGCNTGIQANGPTVNAKLAALIAQYPQAIVSSDPWTYFQAHPSLISSDCIHPSIGSGNVAYRQIYIDALLAGVYQNAL